MLKLHGLALSLACIALAEFGCHDRDQTVADRSGADPSGTAGTTGGGQATGGAGGTSGELDDPFGIGPRFCDQNPGAGGDACSDFVRTSGFYTEPEHLQTNVSATTGLRLWVATEFTPSTPLKEALESGLELHEFGSDVALPFAASWVTEGLEDTGSVRGVYLSVAYDLVPAQALREGWYSLTLPRSARAALGASYTRYTPPLLLQGGPFAELENRDLRADFHVGSLPFLARVKIDYTRVVITFSESVEAAVPPVSVSLADGSPSCAPESWTGAGRVLVLLCSQPLFQYNQLVRLSFGEGLTASGTALRGPDGATSFEVELQPEATLQLDMPAPFGDAGAP